MLYKRADIYKLVTAYSRSRAQLKGLFFGRVRRGVYGGSDPQPPNLGGTGKPNKRLKHGGSDPQPPNLGGTGKHKTRGDSTKLPPLQ